MAKLDSFTRAYLECALWASLDEDGESFDGLYSVDDIAPSAIQQAIADCSAFRETMAEQLELTEADDAQHGHDFWLTRNRHGAGFWDRGYPAEVGKALTDCAHSFGEANVYCGDDGQLYIN
jgi:hypothetical protein